jgi:DNA-directed RNA polymerase subunit omega
MIEDLKDSELIKRIGGKFKITALIQKRLQELIQGSRPLIDNTSGMTYMDIVVREIVEDKIAIDYEASGIVNPSTKVKLNSD